MITVTLAEYKLFTSIGGDKTNAQISDILGYSSTIVENYIGLIYEQPLGADPEEIITYAGRYTYYLQTLSGVDTVTYTSRATAVAVDLVKNVDYVVIDQAITLLTVEPIDYDFLTVTYETDVILPPNDLKLAVILLTQYYYKEEYNKTTMQSGGQQVDYTESTNYPNRVKMILDSHRIL